MSLQCEYCYNGECSTNACTYLCRLFLIWEGTYRDPYKNIIEEQIEVSVVRW